MSFLNPFEKKEEIEELSPAIDDATAASVYPGNQEERDFIAQKDRLAELTRWQQDLSPQYQELVWDLYGVTPDENGNLKSIDGYKAPCNLTGAYHMINILKRIDKNVMMGAWSEARMSRTIISRASMLILDLVENYEKYGIEKSKLRYVYRLIVDTMEPTFVRGLNNGERIFHGKIQKSHEIKQIHPETEKTSFFGKKVF